MDIIIAIIYIVLFIIMMVFVFSIGMIRHYMPKRELALVLVVAFLIGAIGGAFFLEPIYEELPSVISTVEKNVPGNEETLYLDLSSSINMDELKDTLSKTEGFVSFKETSITIPLWKLNDKEIKYFNYVLGNIDSHFKHYNVTKDGKLQIELEENYSSYDALKSFSDWYKLVYGGSISYAQVHAELVVSSSSVETLNPVPEALVMETLPSEPLGEYVTSHITSVEIDEPEDAVNVISSSFANSFNSSS